MKIKFLAHEIEIKPVAKTLAQEGTPAHYHKYNHFIFFDPDVHLTTQQEGVFHELIEAVNYHAGLELNHTHQIVPLSEILFAVLKNNKEMRKFLFKEEV